jgi:hypothetical protein
MSSRGNQSAVVAMYFVLNDTLIDDEYIRLP